MPDLIDRDLTELSPPEQGEARALQAALHDKSATFCRAGGEPIAVPDALADLFEALARAAAEGQPVSIRIGGSALLTARQAAEALGMSRTHLCKLMDSGEIQGSRVGTHRRIAPEEIERYRAARADELAQRYADATRDLPDVPDEPMPKLAGRAPRRPRPQA
jgi:excisionase family DNA binding protein